MDDELPGLAFLRTLCAQLPDVEVVKAYSDPLKLLAEAPELDFDICVSDIHMPGIDGIEVAQLLKGKPVIFTTAHKEYAAAAFDLEAIDYIVKPVQKERFEKAIQKAKLLVKDRHSSSGLLSLNSNKGKVRLNASQVVFIKVADTDKRDKLVYLTDGQELVLKNISFGKLENFLPAQNFCRINKKEIIALQSVRFFTHDDIICVIGGVEKRLALSPNFKNDFLAKFTR